MTRDVLDQRTYTAVWCAYQRGGYEAARQTCQDCGFSERSTYKIIEHHGDKPIKYGPKNLTCKWSGQQICYAKSILLAQPHLAIKDLLRVCNQHGFQIIAEETLRKYMHNEDMSWKRMAKWNVKRILPSVKSQRIHYVNWFTNVNQFTNFIYIDEFGFDTDHSPNYGWSPIGKPALFLLPPLTSTRRTCCIAVSAIAGLIYHDETLETFTSDGFYLFLHNLTLQPAAQLPNTTFIMDNAPIHKESDVDDIMISSGCSTEYLPPYSPALNPVEEVIAVIKSHVADELSHTYQQQLINLTFATPGSKVTQMNLIMQAALQTSLGKVTPALVANCEISMTNKFPAILAGADI
jgi:hypothetical protein